MGGAGYALGEQEGHGGTGALVGALLGGHGLGKIIKAAKFLGDKEAVAAHLSKIEGLAQKASAVVDRHLETLAKLPEMAGKPVARTAAAARAAHTDVEQSRREMDVVRQLASDPQNLMAMSSAISGRFQGSAPTVASAVAAGHANVVGFLASKAPSNTISGPLGTENVPVPASQMATWQQCISVVRDPAGTVMSHVVAGTLTDQHMDAMRACYPGMLGAMQAKTVSKLAGRPGLVNRLPRSQQLSVAKLTGLPIAKLSDPSSFTTIQGIYGASSGPRAKSPSPSLPSGGVAHLSSAFANPLMGHASRIR
jgi:hypothetical protein